MSVSEWVYYGLHLIEYTFQFNALIWTETVCGLLHVWIFSSLPPARLSARIKNSIAAAAAHTYFFVIEEI